MSSDGTPGTTPARRGSGPGNKTRKPARNAKTGSAERGRPARKAPQGLVARRVAADILGNVVHRHRMLASELEPDGGHALYRDLAANDKALVRAILGAALRRRGQIADLLDKLLDRAIPEKTGRVEDILYVAIAQILFLDVADHAAVSVAVEHAGGDRKARPYKGLVNAVLRRLIRERDDLLASQDPVALTTPDWLFGRWSASYGSETARAIAAAHMQEPGLDLTLKPDQDPQAWAQTLGATVLPTGSLRLASAGRVEDLAGYKDGAWWVQDAAAALPARLLGDVRGLAVADLCAAPGGKTAQLAAAGAEVTAADLSPARLKRLKANLTRLSLRATAVAADLNAWQPDAPFDAILLDAPCTATGTARRHPDMPWLKREADIATLAEIQARLLRRALGWLKPGGTLVYCTCSLEPEEGERQIEALLAEDAAVERIPLAADEVPGLDGLITPAGDLRTLPCHWPSDEPRLAGMDGFFAARLRRSR